MSPLAGIWVSLAVAGLALGATLPGNVVDVGYVSYEGNQTYPNTVVYYNIPYAEPPVGNLRFRAPVPLNTSRVADSANGQVVDATMPRTFCIQGTLGDGDAGGGGSEDCLNVDIYSPYGATTGADLPVFVWIHGGGESGNPADFPFDPWVNQSPNVVIVSIYYRLDSIGFLAHPDFVASNGTLGDNNAGFLDQVQALRWISQYISYFGGDPNRVTIGGESAGASSVAIHLVANEGAQLFHGAVAQSVYRHPVVPPATKLDLFQYYATQAGCGSGTSTEQMACLRNVSISALARAQDTVTYNYTGPYKNFVPVLDGTVITDYPTRSVLRGEFARVPLLVGSVSNETLASGASISAALQSYFPALTPFDLAGYPYVYPASEFSSYDEQFRVATGNPTVRCARSIWGGAFSVTNSSWTYRYNTISLTQSLSDTLVEHAAEISMMFGGTNTSFNGTTTYAPETPADLAFASELIAYWLSFVRSADPNTYKLARSPAWPPYTLDYRERIVLQRDPQNTTTVSGSYFEMEPVSETLGCAFSASQVDHEQN
ncbi:alpha/beta-hydrolase [Heliocybe sulcata]|uniref:Carboxylic ester hydrolase n=1 Tax=Heliocybe sulcata TaxID=5364 RepID=A0A5C3N0A6_9AGAM|nr:alpha/beta-hydrolase [Heliocybe sulcata]